MVGRQEEGPGRAGAALPTTVAVATYNVHKFVGTDGRRDPARTFAVLREIDADIVAMQEFDARPGRGRVAVAVADLQDETGYKALVHPTRRGRRGYHGNLILTRFPALGVERHDIGAAEIEPRGLMVADLDAPGGTIRVAVTHLALWPPARARQIRLLATELTPPDQGLLVLAGDLNDWQPHGRGRDHLTERYGAHPTPPTFPSLRPMVGIDQVWVTPRRCLVRLAVHASRRARVASDHLPVRAVLDLRGVGPLRPELSHAARTRAPAPTPVPPA